jgi:ABC-type transport system substrate-binding protein
MSPKTGVSGSLASPTGGGLTVTTHIHRAFGIALMLCLILANIALAQQPKSGGTLRIAFESDITGMDPHTSLGVQAQVLIPSLFNGLVTIDENLNVTPDLAKSWDVNDGGKTYAFHLQKGAHSTMALTSLLRR